MIAPSERNRPIAFPYTKLQVANASVNQGAGFLVTSLAEARRRGVADDRIVFIGYGAAAHESGDFLMRDRYDHSPSLATSIERTLELNGTTVDEISHVELYSCFPCVPKMARRVLGWPLDKPVTVFGGLTFGGGPIGNYMSHAVAAMVENLRGTSDKGLLFANGGYATHNHTILLSGASLDVAFPQNFDCQAEADSRRGEVPMIDEDHTGKSWVETYTVFYDRNGEAQSGVVAARTPAGKRTLAAIEGDDEQILSAFTKPDREPVGREGQIIDGPDGRKYWKFT